MFFLNSLMFDLYPTPVDFGNSPSGADPDLRKIETPEAVGRR